MPLPVSGWKLGLGSWRRPTSLILKMNQRIGPALIIKWRPSRALESQLFVEANRLGILLIDVGSHPRVKAETVAHQSGTNSSAPAGRVHEQRLHMSVINEHEGERVVACIHRKQERRFRKKTAHHLVNGKTIFRQQKIMRGVNCIPPYFNDTPTIFRPGLSDSYHCNSPHLECVYSSPQRGVLAIVDFD